MKQLLFLLFTGLALNAQTQQRLVGAWDFVKTDLDKTGKAGLKPSYAIKDFTLEFASDGALRTTELHRSMVGRWSVSQGGQHIEAELESGRLLVIPIMDLSEEQLVINYRNGIQVMRRTAPDVREIKLPEFPVTVAVKPAQVTGRWKAREIEMPDGAKVPRADMPNLQFQFKPDGGLAALSQGMNSEGNWRLNQNGSAVLAAMNGEIVVFYVLAASERELRLREGPNGITMVLAKLP